MFAMKFLLFVGLVWPCLSEKFLSRVPLERVPEKLKRELLAEIDVVLGREHRNGTEKRLAPIEALLRPTFDALPKNSKGKLDHTAVKYAVHRLFVQKHRWVINGQGSGEAASSMPTSDMIRDRVPEIVQELFEQHTATEGSSLHDVTLLAATLEHLVQNEMHQKLKTVYDVRHLSTDEALTQADAEDIIDLYMMSFVRGLNLAELEPEQIEWLEENIEALYPAWRPAQESFRQVVQTVAPSVQHFTFNDVAAVLTVIGDRFADWQDSQCHIMKDSLMELEDRETGRVKLKDFYHAAIHEGKYQFTETINYLRQIGSLDESDPLNPRVIIPNYISGLSNCIARTSYYSVCCLDECESLLGQLEARLGKPDATAAEIIAVVETLPSATVSAGRTLSASLRRRLDELSRHHDGHIPLHGRLFAQWMHIAYPRECSYPHLSGTTYKKTMEEWEMETGERSGSTLDELVQWTDRLKESDLLVKQRNSASEDEEDESGCMWTMDEELLVERHAPPTETSAPKGGKSWLSRVISCLVFFAAVSSALFGLGDSVRSMFGAKGKKEVDKFIL